MQRVNVVVVALSFFASYDGVLGVQRGGDTAGEYVRTWGQCSGPGVEGVLKCKDTDQCVYQNEFYSACIPISEGVPAHWPDGKVLDNTGQKGPSPPQTPTGKEEPSPTPTGKEGAPAPETPSNPEQEEEPKKETGGQNCVANEGQCFGGCSPEVSCCETGTECIAKHSTYAQCLNATKAESDIAGGGWDGRVLKPGEPIPGDVKSDCDDGSAPEEKPCGGGETVGEYGTCFSKCWDPKGPSSACEEGTVCVVQHSQYGQCLKAERAEAEKAKGWEGITLTDCEPMPGGLQSRADFCKVSESLK